MPHHELAKNVIIFKTVNSINKDGKIIIVKFVSKFVKITVTFILR